MLPFAICWTVVVAVSEEQFTAICKILNMVGLQVCWKMKCSRLLKLIDVGNEVAETWMLPKMQVDGSAQAEMQLIRFWCCWKNNCWIYNLLEFIVAGNADVGNCLDARNFSLRWMHTHLPCAKGNNTITALTSKPWLLGCLIFTLSISTAIAELQKNNNNKHLQNP